MRVLDSQISTVYHTTYVFIITSYCSVFMFSALSPSQSYFTLISAANALFFLFSLVMFFFTGIPSRREK